jgi:hypothetical protein
MGVILAQGYLNTSHPLHIHKQRATSVVQVAQASFRNLFKYLLG